jgi:hypothetical protein
MVLHPSDVRTCWLHAKSGGRSAAARSDPNVQQSFLDAKAAWLKIAKRPAESAEHEQAR